MLPAAITRTDPIARHGQSELPPTIVELKALCQLLEYHKSDQALAQLAQRPILATARLPDGGTILHGEVFRHLCSADVIEALLRAGADVNAADDRGVTVLMRAASKHDVRECDLKIFTRLLQAGARHDSVDSAGKTALMYASELHNSHAMDELLRAGADPNARDLEGNTPLLYVARGFGGFGPSGSRREDPIRMLLQAGADPQVANRQGKTALMMAAAKGKSTELRMLLEAGANPQAVDKYGWTALMHAAEHKHRAAVEELQTYYVIHGLKLNDEERRDVVEKGMRLLSLAQAQARHRQQCALQDDDGKTPSAEDVGAFHRYFEERNETALLELLVRSPALARKAFDPFSGRTPLHEAIGKKCGSPVLEALLEAGANIDATAKSGNTPLMEAISTANDDALTTLLRAGADTEARDSMGRTPLMSAASRFGNSANAVNALLRAGADIEAVDTSGRTALMHAARAQSLQAIETLLDAGAKPDAKDGTGTTALMWVARDRNSGGADRCRDAIELLLRGRANPRAADNDGNTALMWAAKSANRDAAEALQLAYAVRRLPISDAEQRALRENRIPVLTPDQLQARIAAYQDWLRQQPSRSSPQASKPSARVQPSAAQPRHGGDARATAGRAPDRLRLLEAENSQLRTMIEKATVDHQTFERQLDATRAELAQQQAHAAEREAFWQAESARWHAEIAALTQRIEEEQNRLASQRQQAAKARESLQAVHDRMAGAVPDLMSAIQSLSRV